MAEGTVQAKGLTLWYETFGEPTDPAVMLIMGMGAQAIDWPTEFCERLAASGHYAVRFDNREVGLSSWFGGDATYTYEDMADDVLALMDALGIGNAHIIGASMGGMIAQLVAIRHPARVLSLTSISSHPFSAADTPPAGLKARRSRSCSSPVVRFRRRGRAGLRTRSNSNGDRYGALYRSTKRASEKASQEVTTAPSDRRQCRCRVRRASARPRVSRGCRG